MNRMSDFEMIPNEKEIYDKLVEKYNIIQHYMIKYHMTYDEACDFYDRNEKHMKGES